MRRHAAVAVLIGALVAVAPAAVQRAETPRRGGVLLAAIAADAPSLALDPSERKKLVNELERIVLENAYHIPGLW